MPERIEIFWSRSAMRDVDELLEGLALQEGLDLALRFHEQLRKRVANLYMSARRCPIIAEFSELGLDELREIRMPPFRIFFRLSEGKKVTLLGILDGRRDVEELLLARLFKFAPASRSTSP